MNIGIITIIGSILALVATILALFFIVPEKKRAQLNKFGKFLHDLCNFKFLIIEKILQFCYIFATASTLLVGFFMLFWVESYSYYSYYGGYRSSSEWYGYYGLIMMILGPIAVRIVYELMMLALIGIKNIIQINNKLKNQNEEEDHVDPFAAPAVNTYRAPVAPVAPAAPQSGFCANCGTPKNADEFCPNCGQK